MFHLLRNVAVPETLLAFPDRFGGERRNGLRHGDLLIQDDRILGFARSCPAEARILSGDGRLVLPPLVEPHLHLDKAYTIHRLPDFGGNLLAAIQAQEADKSKWTDDDLRLRAGRAMQELLAAGVGLARSHVDWGDGADPTRVPRAWDILSEVAQEWRGRVALQLSCLPAIDILADPDAGPRIAARMAQSGGVLGAWCLGHERRAEGFAAAFRLAEEFGLNLDFHVDEGQGRDLDGLRLIVDEALRTGFKGSVLCGHAVSLMDIDGDALARLLDAMAQAGIALCALPTTNLFLQSRGIGTPDRRGITRLIEAAKAGVRTCLGTDNVQDTFFPLGRHDPLATLAAAVPALHLMAPLADHLPLVSTQAAAAMGAPPVHIDQMPASLLGLAEARTMPELLSCLPHRPSLRDIIAAPAE